MAPTAPRFPLKAFAAAAVAVAASGAPAAPGDPQGPETRLLFGGEPRTATLAAAAAQGRFVALSGSVGQRFTPDGMPLGAAFDTGAVAQAMAMDADGDFSIVWRSGYAAQRLWTRCFTADGAPRGEPLEVFRAQDLVLDLDVAMDDDGDFVVAFATRFRTVLLPGFGYASPVLLSDTIRVRRYTRDCAPVGRTRTVAQWSGLTGGGLNEVRVAMAEDGDFAVAWRADGTSADGLRSRLYHANGWPKGGARTVRPNPSGFGFSVAMAPDGRHAITWQEHVDGALQPSVLVRLYDATGAASGPAFVVNEPSTEARVVPDVAMSDDGHFVVTWTTISTPTSGNDVFARRFAPDGTPLAGEFPGPASLADTQVFSSVLMDPGGDFTLLWSGRNVEGEGSFARRFEGP